MNTTEVAATTPGPWRVPAFASRIGASRTVDIGAGDCDWAVGTITAVLPNDCGPRDVEREARLLADARLIASAPEMLVVLERSLAIETSVTQAQERELRDGYLTQLRAALAKAKGESP